MNINLKQNEVWFATGSQNLYGPETLEQVAADSQKIARALNDSAEIPVSVVFKPVLTSSEAIHSLCLEANAAPNCIGLITWMHTFSPAKMWIAGLSALKKPFVHLHTQFNKGIPWSDIDMDFMNLNQSAHGDREFGFISSRMRLDRKVIVGHWQAPEVQKSLGEWARAASAWADAQGLKIARFGDQMREVAVTDGDRVEAQIRMGYSVYGFVAGDLGEYLRAVSDRDIDRLVEEYEAAYQVVPELLAGGKMRQSLCDSARIEIALRNFLDEGGFKAFTTSFQDLHGLSQLPGLACQRMMADNYGFAAEGDWKTAALVRSLKVMGAGLEGGSSFMEDYTYHLNENGDKVLGAHMLEICPSLADGKPSLEIHPLSIGDKADPVRLVFTTQSGPAVNASIMDMGNRFRMVVNTVDVVPPEAPLPKLPVARALWKPHPDLKTSAAAWILAGGAHHTGFSQAITAEYLEDFAEMAGMEFLLIDENTRLSDFKKELRWNDVYYMFKHGY